jgi:hypothetical protein
MKKILLVMGVLILAAVGYFIYNFYFKSSPPDQYGRYIGRGCQVEETCNGLMNCEDKKLSQAMGGSICMTLPEDSCYFKSGMRCEKQSDGHCGWTNTNELVQCIDFEKSHQLQF